jgi:hypothetical protein
MMQSYYMIDSSAFLFFGRKELIARVKRGEKDEVESKVRA